MNRSQPVGSRPEPISRYQLAIEYGRVSQVGIHILMHLYVRLMYSSMIINWKTVTVKITPNLQNAVMNENS